MMYEEIRDHLRTGDVIGFSGKGRASNIIKAGTFCDISHVGMVYKTLGDRVVIMESTSLNDIADCETGEFIKGVQKQYLSDRLDTYDGQVYWYPLNKPIENDIAMIGWLADVHGKKVPYDTVQAICSALDILVPDNKEDFTRLFCSEMVCRALQLGGVVSDELNASEQTPADVIKYDCLDERVQIG